MPKKIPLVRIGVSRDKQTVFPEIGKPFDFTKEEIAELTTLAETTKEDYFRDLVNEETAAPASKKAEKSEKTTAPAEGDGAL